MFLPKAESHQPIDSRSIARLVIIGACAAFFLVALINQLTNGESATNPKLALNTRQSTCVEMLSGKANQDVWKKSTAALMKDFPSTAHSMFATVDSDGKVSKLKWNADNWERLSGTHRLVQQHKFIEFPGTGHRFLLYPDNTVVDLDTRNCVIIALYEHTPNGELHPLIRNVIKPQVHVATDKKKGNSCSKGNYGRCYRDGQYCRDWMSPLGQSYQWTQVSCPSGWSKNTDMNNQYSGTQPQYSCGCGTACVDPLECDSLGSRGKHCPLSRTACNLVEGLDGTVSDAGTVIGNIQSAVDVGAALLSITPAGNAIGIIASFAGFAGNLGMSPEAAYNEMLGQLHTLAENVMTCIDFKIAEEITRQIESDLITIANSMSPSHLEGTTVEDRLTKVWEPNTQKCKDIGSDFQSFQGRSYAKEVLPLGLNATEMCLANYVGYVADLNAQNEEMSILTIREYRTILSQISTSIASVIDAWYNSLKGENECGFYHSETALLNDQVAYLRTNVLANVKALQTAFNKCPTNNIARGKTTAQSSTSNGGVPGRAVDGNKNSNWGAGSCTHTASGNNQYWYVDLGANYEVCSVRITNRGDCCWERLKNFDIFVADNTPTGTYPAVGSVYDTCASSLWQSPMNPPKWNSPKRFTCTTPVSGRYVSIRLRNPGVLTLCEVQVYGRKLPA